MANVELSSEEIIVFQNADFLFTKNKVIEKLQTALGQIAQEYQTIVKNEFSISHIMDIENPKISKGEQYEGLPYLMLDYPCIFTKTDIFAIRSFVWWGNYFSIELLLKGQRQSKWEMQLISMPILQNWHIDPSISQWSHTWNHDKAAMLKDVDNSNYVVKDFFKLSKQLPLSEWQNMADFFVTNFRELCQAISSLNV